MPIDVSATDRKQQQKRLKVNQEPGPRVFCGGEMASVIYAAQTGIIWPVIQPGQRQGSARTSRKPERHSNTRQATADFSDRKIHAYHRSDDAPRLPGRGSWRGSWPPRCNLRAIVTLPLANVATHRSTHGKPRKCQRRSNRQAWTSIMQEWPAGPIGDGRCALGRSRLIWLAQLGYGHSRKTTETRSAWPLSTDQGHQFASRAVLAAAVLLSSRSGLHRLPRSQYHPYSTIRHRPDKLFRGCAIALLP